MAIYYNISILRENQCNKNGENICVFISDLNLWMTFAITCLTSRIAWKSHFATLRREREKSFNTVKDKLSCTSMTKSIMFQIVDLENERK